MTEEANFECVKMRNFKQSTSGFPPSTNEWQRIWGSEAYNVSETERKELIKRKLTKIK